MSQKAWMNAYTKGSKEMQARLAQVHAKNPEFQAFLAKHGFGGNLSVKQSGLQKKSSVATVKPVTQPHPESNKNANREAMIKAAAEKLRNRRLASGNRAAFGGELGGGFSMPMSGFRRYSEETELNELDKRTLQSYDAKAKNDLKGLVDKGDRWKNRLQAINRVKGLALSQKRLKDKNYGKASVNEQSQKRLEKYIKKATKSADRLAYYSDSRNDPDWIKSNKRDRMIAVARKRIQATDESINEEVPYKDAQLKMRRGGWVVMRNGKQQGVIHPTEELAKAFADNTRKTLAHKLGEVLRRKAKEIARGMGSHSEIATESAANRERVLAYDSAVTSSPTALKVKPKKTITGKMKSYVRRTFAFTKKTLTAEGQDPKVLALRAAGKHEEARKLERAALAKGFAAAKRDTLNKPGEKRKPDQEQLRIDSQKWHNGD